jgi:hypothetical protein
LGDEVESESLAVLPSIIEDNVYALSLAADHLSVDLFTVAVHFVLRLVR